MVLDHTVGWVMPFPRCPLAVARSSCGVGEAADLAVAQPVVDEREQLAGGGDAADAATAAGTDAGFDRSDLRVTDSARDCLDGGPAQQPGALFICGSGGGGQGGVAVFRERRDKPASRKDWKSSTPKE
jgi:hypothetical protein